jgi:L-iditol 2-dehydrogenase
MQAARLIAAETMRLEQVNGPEVGPGDVLVRVEAAGICGSDRHMFRGEYPTALPVTLGHEFCGVVEAVGAEARRVKVGDLVTADPNIACGHCPACRSGRVNLCHNLQAIGVTRDGGFAQWVAIPEPQAHVLPAGLDPELGAFSEPLACCLHGLDVARIKPGDTVAVLGGGIIGLLMVQLARLAGAAQVVLLTRQAPRREMALVVGATVAIDPAAGDAADAVREVTGGGADVVLECAGVPETVEQSVRMVRRGGAAVLFGVTAKGATASLEPFDLLFREVRLEAAYLNPHTHARAAAMIAAAQLQLLPLISRRIGLSELPAELGAAPRQGDVKVKVRPNG